jgi:hypothetical protein
MLHSDVPPDARSILTVKGCSNGILRYVRRYGKSPCFLAHTLLRVVDVDHLGYVFRHLNIHDLLYWMF